MIDDPFAPAALASIPVSDNIDDAETAPKVRKKASTSPTQRSLAHLRKQGCVAQVVERYNQHAHVRQDLFGCIDVVALHPDGTTIGVQACAMSSVSERVKKINASEHITRIRACGWRVLVQGWQKGGPNKSPRLREVDVSSANTVIE